MPERMGLSMGSRETPPLLEPKKCEGEGCKGKEIPIEVEWKAHVPEDEVEYWKEGGDPKESKGARSPSARAEKKSQEEAHGADEEDLVERVPQMLPTDKPVGKAGGFEEGFEGTLPLAAEKASPEPVASWGKTVPCSVVLGEEKGNVGKEKSAKEDPHKEDRAGLGDETPKGAPLLSFGPCQVESSGEKEPRGAVEGESAREDKGGPNPGTAVPEEPEACKEKKRGACKKRGIDLYMAEKEGGRSSGCHAYEGKKSPLRSLWKCQKREHEEPSPNGGSRRNNVRSPFFPAHSGENLLEADEKKAGESIGGVGELLVQVSSHGEGIPIDPKGAEEKKEGNTGERGQKGPVDRCAPLSLQPSAGPSGSSEGEPAHEDSQRSSQKKERGEEPVMGNAPQEIPMEDQRKEVQKPDPPGGQKNGESGPSW